MKIGEKAFFLLHLTTFLAKGCVLCEKNRYLCNLYYKSYSLRTKDPIEYGAKNHQHFH